jgi:signal transduction histidine kinase
VLDEEQQVHDETLQALASVRLLLASALQQGDAAANERAMREGVATIDPEIQNLRARIGDLRPAMLDELGLVAPRSVADQVAS